jgi:hypothetical protein
VSVVTALKGSAPSPNEIKAFLDQHERNQAAEVRLLDAIFPNETTEPTAPEEELTEREKRIRTLAGIPDGEVLPPALAGQLADLTGEPQATIQRLDAEGEPVGEPITTPMSGIKIIDPIFGTAPNFPSDDDLRAKIADAPISGDWAPVDASTIKRGGTPFPVDPAIADVVEASKPRGWRELYQGDPSPAKLCGAVNSAGAGCMKEHGHEYLHEFAKAAAPLDSGHDTAGA